MGHPSLSLAAFVWLAVGFNACDNTSPSYQGRSLSSWMRDLESDHDYSRRAACVAVAQMGPEATKALPLVARLLEDLNPGVRAFAEDALAKMGPHAVTHLVPLLSHEQPYVQMHAASALVRVDPTHQAGLKHLVRALTSVGNADLSDQAQERLMKLGEPAIAEILPLLADPYPPVRVRALKTLAAMGPRAGKSLMHLVEMSGSEQDPEVRQAIILALAKLGPATLIAEPLRSFLNDPDDDVARTAGSTLSQVGIRNRPTRTEVKEAAQAVAKKKKEDADSEPLHSLLSE